MAYIDPEVHCIHIAALDAFRHGNILETVAAEKNVLYEKLVLIRRSGRRWLRRGMVAPFSHSQYIGELNGDHEAYVSAAHRQDTV